MISSPRFLSASSSFALASLLLAAPAGAQITEADSDYPDEEIVVTAERPRGAVVSEIPPVVELSEADIASFGASSVQDLLEAISSQTRSSRGRGSGRPIVLINGQRTSVSAKFAICHPKPFARCRSFRKSWRCNMAIVRISG